MIVKNVVGKAPRWYDKDGNAIYEVIGKNGKPKAPTIKEARELNLLPSVTTIISQLSKPGLEKWKISQAIISALTLPREAGESDHGFAERVATDATEEGKLAAQKGTDIHSAIETYIRTNVVPEGAENFCLHYNNFMENFSPGIGSMEIEFKVVNESLGYAGRGDLKFFDQIQSKWVFVDFKTQDVGAGKPNFYPDWAMQIAAYSQGVDAIGVSLVFDRESGVAYSKEWDNLHIELKKFQLLLEYFKLEKKLC